MGGETHTNINNGCSTSGTETIISQCSNTWKQQSAPVLIKTNNIITYANFVQNFEDVEYLDIEELTSNTELGINTQVIKELTFTHISDSYVTPRRIASLPTSLQYARGVVTTRRIIPAKCRFGPVAGMREIIKDLNKLKELTVNYLARKLPIFLINNNDNSFTYIDVTDEDKSNWLSLIKLGDNATANIFLYNEGEDLYAVTTQPLTPRTELAFGYAKHYLNEVAHVGEYREIATTDLFHIDSECAMNECKQCGDKFATQDSLCTHIELQHNANGVVKKRRKPYKCRHCLNVFSTTFCLKRHKQYHCKHNTLSTELKSISNDLEIKIPSDESIQNILDSSNSILYLDKALPNLDLSMSSKSDDVDDILDLSKRLKCRYCKDDIKREEMEKHLRLCRNRRFNCICGRYFRNKEKLTKHVHSAHGHTNKGDIKQVSLKKNENTNPSDIGPIYTCEDCKISFKRRGMLMNHYWRKHPTQAPKMSRLPLLTKERTYLCSVCPKSYRSGAKRDLHMKQCHPGRSLSPNSSYCLETGIRTKNATSCPLCVKEYATRAKMLQHMRMKHPRESENYSNIKKKV